MDMTPEIVNAGVYSIVMIIISIAAWGGYLAGTKLSQRRNRK